MTVEKLREYRRLQLRVKTIDGHLTTIDSAIKHCTSAYGLAPTARRGDQRADPLPAYIDELHKYEVMFAEETIDAMRVAVEVETWLHSLRGDYEKVMRLRYVDGLRWRVVARSAGYSIDHCKRINRECIEKA